MKTKEEIQEGLRNWKAITQSSHFDRVDNFIGIMGFLKINGTEFTFVASNGEGWEHVSVAGLTRCPDWSEMCLFRRLFWRPEEAVMQLHPAEENCVNVHNYCLHLWRPKDKEIPLPPKTMV